MSRSCDTNSERTLNTVSTVQIYAYLESIICAKWLIFTAAWYRRQRSGRARDQELGWAHLQSVSGAYKLSAVTLGKAASRANVPRRREKGHSESLPCVPVRSQPRHESRLPSGLLLQPISGKVLSWILQLTWRCPISLHSIGPLIGPDHPHLLHFPQPLPLVLYLRYNKGVAGMDEVCRHGGK